MVGIGDAPNGRSDYPLDDHRAVFAFRRLVVEVPVVLHLRAVVSAMVEPTLDRLVAGSEAVGRDLNTLRDDAIGEVMHL